MINAKPFSLSGRVWWCLVEVMILGYSDYNDDDNWLGMLVNAVWVVQSKGEKRCILDLEGQDK